MAKVYVVTTGDCSDHRIEGIYTDDVKAGELVEDLKWDGQYSADIEDWELDQPRPQRFLCVWMGRDGDTKRVYSQLYGPIGLYRFEDLFTEQSFRWVVATEDKERAVKTVNEKRTQILALNIWGDYEKVKEMVK